MGIFRKDPNKNYHNNHCESCGSLIHDLPYNGIIDFSNDKVCQRDYHYFPPCWDKDKIGNDFRVIVFYEVRSIKQLDNAEDWKQRSRNGEESRMRLDTEQNKIFRLTRPEGVTDDLF